MSVIGDYMTIIYTCPKCGGDLHDICIATYPPKRKLQCFACGWSESTIEDNAIIKIPYIENKFNTRNPCRNCTNHPSNGGTGICHCTLGSIQVTC